MNAFDTEGLFSDDYLHFFADDLEEVADSETDLIWRALELEPGMNVLDLACGHGRIANRLAERGCRVTGVDITPHFLERAREDAGRRGVTAAYVEGDMRSLPFGQRFDRVINCFNSFGYFDDRGNRRVLSEAFRVLNPGGRLMLVMDDRDHVLRNFQPASIYQRADDILVDRRRYEPLTGRAVVERTVVRGGRTRYVSFFVRLFTFTELRDWLVGAGFAAVAGYEDANAPLVAESRRMITIATR